MKLETEAVDFAVLDLTTWTVDMASSSSSRKEAKVIVFEEPTYTRKSSKEVTKERNLFLVSTSKGCLWFGIYGWVWSPSCAPERRCI